MSNDEKLNSRDDETPPKSDAKEKYDASRDDGERAAGHEASSGGKDGDRGLEPDYGMPHFGLFGEAPEQEAETAPRPGRSSMSTDEALKAARASLDNPPREGTGWESTSSIEPRPGFMEASEQHSGEIERPRDEEPVRNQATVMPFPGSVVQRPAEPAPSDMLRGSGEARETDLFGIGPDAPAEALPDLDMSAHDTIADAVQSALRNVYGGAAPREEDEPIDLGGFTVADSLRQAAAVDDRDDDEYWADTLANRRDGRREDLFAAPQDDVDAEGVLDYLYGERRGAEREQPPMPADASLRDLGDALGYDRDSRARYGFDERAPRGSMREYEDPAYGGPDRYADRGTRGFSADRAAYPDGETEPEWDDQPFVVTSSSDMDPQHYPSPVASANSDSLASGSPDSSHLLGAAGLGLIGGIALAGVLAVFVFNSFVDEVDTGGPGQAAKVVDRLNSPVAETPIARTEPSVIQPEPEPAAAEPEPRIAAVQPEEPQARPEPQLQPLPEPQAEPIEPPAAAEPAEPDARLAVADTAGEDGAAIPLNISLGREEDERASLVSLKGFPAFAKLSTGIDVGGGQWLLPPSRLEDLSVTTPEGSSGSFQIEAELLKDDAQTAIYGPLVFTLRVGEAARQAELEGDTALTTSEQAAKLAEVSDGGGQIETDFLTQMLIRDGNKLMRDGDILGARRLYEQAAADGNPEASLAMGRSFDPSYFEKLEVKTGKPDPATAFQWYKKALDGGLVTARVKIDGLKQWLQR
jgi:hypothetical protein